MSADPLAVHVPGEADSNLYAYVEGKALRAVDPLGLAPWEFYDNINTAQLYLDWTKKHGTARDVKNLDKHAKRFAASIGLDLRKGLPSSKDKKGWVGLLKAAAKFGWWLDRFANAKRTQAVVNAITDGSGRMIKGDEIPGVAYAIGRMEKNGWKLKGAVKIGKGNHGIDLEFTGTGKNKGKTALVEAKSGDFSFGKLDKDTKGLRQGTEGWFRDRALKAGRADLVDAIDDGDVEYFVAFAGDGKHGTGKDALVETNDKFKADTAMRKDKAVSGKAQTWGKGAAELIPDSSAPASAPSTQSPPLLPAARR